MGVIDLDSAKAARVEATGEAHSIRFGGTDWAIPSEMSLACANLLATGDLEGGVRDLLKEQADKFFELEPSVRDVETLMREIAKLYGFDNQGESSASSPSSSNTTERSRPISRVSTPSTSETASTEVLPVSGV